MDTILIGAIDFIEEVGRRFHRPENLPEPAGKINGLYAEVPVILAY